MACTECRRTTGHKMDCTVGRRSVPLTDTRQDNDAEAIALGFDAAGSDTIPPPPQP